MKKILYLLLVTIIAVGAILYIVNNKDVLDPNTNNGVDTDITRASTPDTTPDATSTSSPTLTPDPYQTWDPTEDLVDGIPAEYQSLSFFKPELKDRYIAYILSNPEFDYKTIITYVNIGLGQPFYSNINLIDDPNSTTVLVNKYNKLPDDFEPKLVEIPSTMCAPAMGAQYLREDAKQAFELMHNDAKQLDLNITAYGTYRSISLQHSIWHTQVNSGRTIEDVDNLNSRGGHSEHHTGLTVDVIRNTYSVESTKEYLWYKDNAHLYGFIIRYPKGKEHITGYSYEPWHLRYLGVELATEVYNSGLTYEEYYIMYLE